MRKPNLSLTLASVAVVGITSTLAAGTYGKKDIVDTAVSAGQFNTLAAALQAAGLVEALKGEGPFTVFAPTDAAFAKLPAGTVETLLKPENKDQLVAILTYHVVAGEVPASAVVKLSKAKTLNGQQVDIALDHGTVHIDNAQVVKTDIECRNGVIHVIDSVILPSQNDIVATAQSAGSFKTLLTAATAAGLVDTLQSKGPFTVFAPTDEAFAKVPADTLNALLKPENKAALQKVLLYHVVPGRVFASDVVKLNRADTAADQQIRIINSGGKVKINNATVVTVDIDASNGVIHVIDAVLIPDGLELASAMSPRNLIETAIERGAPMFNRGDADACAAVYEVAVQGLLLMDNLPATAQERLASALVEIQDEHDASDRAWTLRHALDAAYNAMPMEMPVRQAAGASGCKGSMKSTAGKLAGF